MHTDLDHIDLRILRELQVDSSTSAVDLAERVGISQSLCSRRIQFLKDSGYIKSKVTLLDRKQLGLNAQIFVLIKLSSRGRANLDEFAAAIERLPEVLECYVLMGSVDFVLRIVAEDVDDYERFFFNNISKLPGVQEVTSFLALREVKSTTALPLPQSLVRGRAPAATKKSAPHLR